MYLHLGDEVILPYADIVGIFDLDNVTVTKTGRAFLQEAERAGQVTVISDNLPKSFIVCRRDGRDAVYLSPISAATLRLRISRGLAAET